ncbi:DNA endonuclease RBBP8-like isoform X3 [Seriola lalandi dorsalis]|uniref:DNA endonuclease RBBP8-like isoform X3 n=1 Tax=Seriola lalandi dorsalis TaxID=1841481 RepID=UPI000C6F5D07|nr:DNA endonuclease RBBP8-like isoform X3 [Seriola lalandi dorsalis]
MECFNDLLLKLRELHEREVDGWQVKVQELSNKKGCDIKRMEELFTRNQQMKEQHRLLTDNIKTLENRLRAGLCDRCTVTQEVATRRQHEFEASQIQSLQHISILAGEMNNLKKENKRLRDEIRNLRTALESHSDHSSNSSSVTEVKQPNSSPDLSPCSVPVALIAEATSRASNQPSDGDTAVKTERDQRREETKHRQLRGMNRSHFEPYKSVPLSTLTLPSWKTEHSVTRERRSQSIERLDQRSSIPPQALLPKNSSSSTSGEVNSNRHVLHTPVPCRPQPIKSSPVTLPWPLSESSDWVSVAAAGTSQLMQPSSKLNVPRFPNLIPISQHTNSRKQVFGSPWSKQSSPQPPVKDPTVVFRLRSLSEHVESQITPPDKKEIQPTKAEMVSGEELKEIYEGPLDLSDRGKSKSNQTPRDDSPSAVQVGEIVQKSPDKDVKTNTYAQVPVSSPSHVAQPSSSSSSTPPIDQQEEEPTGDHNHKQVTKDQEQKEEVNGKTDQSSEKKVPVLTISLRPVVLETLNSALQKQEALSLNGKSSSPADERESSSEEQGEDGSASGQESIQGRKRKRTSVETESNRDSDTDRSNVLKYSSRESVLLPIKLYRHPARKENQDHGQN